MAAVKKVLGGFKKYNLNDKANDQGKRTSLDTEDHDKPKVTSPKFTLRNSSVSSDKPDEQGPLTNNFAGSGYTATGERRSAELGLCPVLPKPRAKASGGSASAAGHLSLPGQSDQLQQTGSLPASPRLEDMYRTPADVVNQASARPQVCDRQPSEDYQVPYNAYDDTAAPSKPLPSVTRDRDNNVTSTRETNPVERKKESVEKGEEMKQEKNSGEAEDDGAYDDVHMSCGGVGKMDALAVSANSASVPGYAQVVKWGPGGGGAEAPTEDYSYAAPWSLEKVERNLEERLGGLTMAHPPASGPPGMRVSGLGGDFSVEPNDLYEAVQTPVESYSYYHGQLPRTQAEVRLQEEAVGNFLVRKAESGTACYSLSLRGKDQVLHMRITQNSEGKYVVGTRSHAYDSVPDLIEAYKKKKLPIKGFENVFLRLPVPCDRSQ